jgi:hypothetical protein
MEKTKMRIQILKKYRILRKTLNRRYKQLRLRISFNKREFVAMNTDPTQLGYDSTKYR